jgi:hypothetical protein
MSITDLKLLTDDEIVREYAKMKWILSEEANSYKSLPTTN